MFVDIDGDGDFDVVVGEWDGNFNYYENIGSSISLMLIQCIGVDNFFDGINIGNDLKLVFVDIDGDGDQDLVVGEDDGILNYYENIMVIGVGMDMLDNIMIMVEVIDFDGFIYSEQIGFCYGGVIIDIVIGIVMDEVMYGFEGNDIFNGGGGDDILIGGSGFDLFLYGFGDGDDVVYGGVGGGWIDVIDVGGGLGINDYGIDWIIIIIEGFLDNVDMVNNKLDLFDNVYGMIEFINGLKIEFLDVEEICWQQLILDNGVLFEKVLLEMVGFLFCVFC